jgi:pyruvate ferredoxin oxidoreductase alpha subunit
MSGPLVAGKPVGMEVSIAIAEAAKLADVDIVAAYPITPQTHIVEHLAEIARATGVSEGQVSSVYQLDVESLEPA